MLSCSLCTLVGIGEPLLRMPCPFFLFLFFNTQGQIVESKMRSWPRRSASHKDDDDNEADSRARQQVTPYILYAICQYGYSPAHAISRMLIGERTGGACGQSSG